MLSPSMSHFGPCDRNSSHYETALLQRRARVHVAAAVEVVVDLGRGADHAAIEEYVEGGRFQVLVGKRPGAIVLPQDGEQQRRNDGVDVDAKYVARRPAVVERLHQLAIEGVEHVIVA